MDFKCFFIEYKIGLKDIKHHIPLKELPKYRKNFFKFFCLELFIFLLIFISITSKLANEKVIKLVTWGMYLIFIFYKIRKIFFSYNYFINHILY